MQKVSRAEILWLKIIGVLRLTFCGRRNVLSANVTINAGDFSPSSAWSQSSNSEPDLLPFPD